MIIRRDRSVSRKKEREREVPFQPSCAVEEKRSYNDEIWKLNRRRENKDEREIQILHATMVTVCTERERRVVRRKRQTCYYPPF